MTADTIAGTAQRDEVLEPRGRTAFAVRAGETVRIIDLEGQQVADIVCFARENPAEKLSVHNTALIQGTIYISAGHRLLSDRCRALMTITADTCGKHDLLAGSCSEGTNRFHRPRSAKITNSSPSIWCMTWTIPAKNVSAVLWASSLRRARSRSSS